MPGRSEQIARRIRGAVRPCMLDVSYHETIFQRQRVSGGVSWCRWSGRSAPRPRCWPTPRRGSRAWRYCPGLQRGEFTGGTAQSRSTSSAAIPLPSSVMWMDSSPPPSFSTAICPAPHPVRFHQFFHHRGGSFHCIPAAIFAATSD